MFLPRPPLRDRRRRLHDSRSGHLPFASGTGRCRPLLPACHFNCRSQRVDLLHCCIELGLHFCCNAPQRSCCRCSSSDILRSPSLSSTSWASIAARCPCHSSSAAWACSNSRTMLSTRALSSASSASKRLQQLHILTLVSWWQQAAFPSARSMFIFPLFSLVEEA